MALELSLKHEYIPQLDGNPSAPYHKDYPGKNTEQMPILLKHGRIPLHFAGIEKRRYDLRDLTGEDQKISGNWQSNYGDTSDFNFLHEDNLVFVFTCYGNGRISKLGEEVLSWVNPDEPLYNRGIDLRGDKKERLLSCTPEQGVIKVKLNKVGSLNSALSEQEALDHFGRKILNRDEKVVPSDYAIAGLHQLVVPYNFKTGNFDKGMAFYPIQDIDTLKAWFVNRFERRSNANGRLSLNNVSGRFLGIAPEALSAFGKGVLNIRAYTPNDAKKYANALQRIRSSSGLLDESLVRDLSSLEGKL